MFLVASDRVRRNSLVLCLVAEAVEIPQDRLAEVEVASVDESRGEGGGEGGSECLFEVHHHHLGSQDRTVGSKGLESLQVQGRVLVGEEYVDCRETPGSVICQGGKFCMEDQDLVEELRRRFKGSVKVPAGALC